MRERKPIDEALRCFLDEHAALGVPPEMTDEVRTRVVRSLMLRSLEIRSSIAGLPNGVEMREMEFGSGLTARLYEPPGAQGLLPVMVYLHGGGWVAGSVVTLDPFCRLLCEAAGVMIASIEYRLAPEHRYPAALEDGLTGVEWVIASAPEWGGDATRIALGGDSAGANLAAVAANRFCATAEAYRLRGLLLLYPVTDHPTGGHESYSENATGYGLEASAMRWFWQQYAGGVSPDDAEVSPLRLQKVPALPSTLVATAEYDVLRDEGIAYAEKLAEAGVAVTHLHAPDMHHNFPVSPGTVGRFPQGVAMVAEVGAWLRRTVG